jgi:FeS assembly SUF system protein
LKDRIIAALKRVYDPEIPVNIYDLGLIYEVEVSGTGRAHVVMTLTAPNCPVAGSLPMHVESAVRSVPGVTDAKVELTFDPPWSKDKMSDAAKLALGFDDVVPPTSLQQ